MPELVDELGNVIKEIDYENPEEIQQAEDLAEKTPGIDIEYAPGGTFNAPDIRENYQLGGLIPGQPGFGQRPLVEPPLPPVAPTPVAPIAKPPLSPIMKEGGKVKEKK